MKKINYFFPVFEGENFKNYFDDFKKSSFFKKYENFVIFVACYEKDEATINFVKKEIEVNKNFKLIILNKPFTYNDAFYNTCKYFDGDIVLLGDLKIKKIDIIFEKCMEKHEKNANVVHIVKKHSKFKRFIFNIFKNVYNFFVKLFTEKKDKLNVVSLGLIDKNIIDILKELPNKCCFLKNTSKLLGFETRTIYIPPDTKTYQPNFKCKTSSLITAIVSLGFSVSLTVVLILLNIFKISLSPLNIIGILVVLLSLIMSLIFINKHTFDIRNFENKKERVEEIEN